MNETSSILLVCIVGAWFLTSPRFKAFKQVLGSGSNQAVYDPNNPLPQVGAKGGPMETNPNTSPTPQTWIWQLPGTAPASGS